MELQTQKQFQANMVKWRDDGALTIAKWTEVSRVRQVVEPEDIAAECRETRTRLNYRLTKRSQLDFDREYTYNCA